MLRDQLSSDATRFIRRALLAFFDASARDLPWRRSRDPYAVWVSEVMAQQTRLDTVIPYYARWMQQFPDVHALAAAPVDDVLKQWEGLGYYSRARNLHAAARIIAERHGGTLPGQYDALRALPGIGDYTAGAVSSIAFGVREPVVDGNVRRVLARLLDDPAPPPRRLREVAAALVPEERPGDFNQALMELGSLVCTPRAPRCDDCPLREHCAAHDAGTQLDRPRTVPKKATPVYDVAIAVLRAPDGRVLVMRRPETGLLAGLWSFPGRVMTERADAAAAAAQLAAAKADAGSSANAEAKAASIAAEIAADLAPGAVAGEPTHIGNVAHAFSHRREVYRCHLIEVAAHAVSDGSSGGATADRVWMGGARDGVTLPRAQQKIHELVRGEKYGCVSSV
jgi:A/G-specific adenine glycosylase